MTLLAPLMREARDLGQPPRTRRHAMKFRVMRVAYLFATLAALAIAAGAGHKWSG